MLAVVASAVLLAACASTGTATPGTGVVGVGAPPTTTTAAGGPAVGAPSTTASGIGLVPSGVTTTVPSDPFYAPPDPLPAGKDGDVIRSRPLTTAPNGSRGWEVLYRSQDVAGHPIAVSGVVIAPTAATTDAPAGQGRPVLSWAHPTTGLGDQCAPSRSYADGSELELAFVPGIIAKGWVWAATDYEGLGTPGVHPYLVGLSEARGVLDIVRAAEQLDGTGASATSPVMIAGHSQGGGAALIAAEQAATYAPDLDVVGTAAGAPTGDLSAIVSGTVNTTTVTGYGLMIIAGLHAAYPSLPLDAVMNAKGAAVLAFVAGECSTATVGLREDPAVLDAKDPMTDPRWAAAVNASTAGSVKPNAPVFIFHGTADSTVPVALSDATLQDYCRIGATVELKKYAGASHSSVVFSALGDVLAFFSARLNGTPATSSC